MENNNKLSLSDSDILREDEKLLNLLLKDHTTGKNIKWGTDSYINHGYSFRNDQEIKIDLITGWYEGFIRPRVDKDIDVQLERQRNRAEVFTPSWVIKLQVDAALEDMEKLPLTDFIQTKWLEITCGEAPYMVNRYDMETGEVIPLKERAGFIDVKFKRLNEEIDSEEEWIKLAVEIYKASYGYEYQGDSLLLARENLILTFIDNYFYMFGTFPKEKILLEITKIISLNVFQMDGLTYEVPYSDGGLEESGTQLSLFEEVEVKENITPKLATIKLWKKNKFVEVKKMSERENKSMKFDVVIGNPPYQNQGVGEKARDEPIYNYFMDESYKIGKKTILITPARFLFNAGQTPKKWNKKMLSDPHLKVINFEANSNKIFTNTNIEGGIVITYRDYEEVFGAIKTFIPLTQLENIYQKVKQKSSKFLDSIHHTRSSYKFSEEVYDDFPEGNKTTKTAEKLSIGSNIFKKFPEVFFNDKPDTKNEYGRIYGLEKGKRKFKWIKKKYISAHENFENYKVFVPKSNGSGSIGKVDSTQVIGAPDIGDQYVGHTQTFISFGSFKTLYEATSLQKYIKTKFCRVLVGTKKVTQDNARKDIWMNVPIQEFGSNSDIDWTKSISEIDRQLYKKYGLNNEEIDFIETNIKEME